MITLEGPQGIVGKSSKKILTRGRDPPFLAMLGFWVHMDSQPLPTKVTLLSLTDLGLAECHNLKKNTIEHSERLLSLLTVETCDQRHQLSSSPLSSPVKYFLQYKFMKCPGGIFLKPSTNCCATATLSGIKI